MYFMKRSCDTTAIDRFFRYNQVDYYGRTRVLRSSSSIVINNVDFSNVIFNPTHITYIYSSSSQLCIIKIRLLSYACLLVRCLADRSRNYVYVLIYLFTYISYLFLTSIAFNWVLWIKEVYIVIVSFVFCARKSQCNWFAINKSTK